MNEKNSALSFKSKEFALKIIKAYKYLTDDKKEFIMSKQLLRSGTSVGANIAEGECAISDKDFLNKLYIAFKECNETLYWIDLLYEAGYFDNPQFESLYNSGFELKRMLSSATKNVKERIES